MAQWFANRGYACLMVNFRASTGYGKAFLNAGNKQWGKTMHDDLIDACNWAIAQGYTDSKKIAIFGGSYGGYAAFAGVTFTPKFFACAVDIVGPSNLKTLISTSRPTGSRYGRCLTCVWATSTNPKDADLHQERLAAVQGRQDPPPALDWPGGQRPSRQASRVRADRRRDREERRPCELCALFGRGARLRPPQPDRLQCPRRSLLAENLGGRCEPLAGEKIPGSTAVIREVGKQAAPRGSIVAVCKDRTRVWIAASTVHAGES